MRKIVFVRSVGLILILIQLNAKAFSQEIASSFSRLYMGFSAYGNRFTDAFSFCANQASLAGIQEMKGGVYSEKPWMLEDLCQYTAVLAMPGRNGGWGISIDYAGDGYYRQWKTGIAYGRKLADRLDIGVQFSYSRIGISGYGSAGTAIAEVGIQVHLTPELTVGMQFVHAGPPVPARGSPQKLASVYTSGMGYELSSRVFLKMDLSREEEQPVRAIVGIQYNPEQSVLIRAGLVSGGSLLMGTGLCWKNLRTDLTALVHPQLGISPGLLLSFRQPD